MTKEKDSENLEIFNKTFGDLLKENTETVQAPPLPETEGNLQEVLFGSKEPDDQVASEEEILKFSEEVIPEYIGDPDWEAFASRAPIPPLSREQEARAISIGLQEIRKIREYMLYNYRHLTNEYTRVYATFSLLLTQDFDGIFGEAHKKISLVMDDLEHLIAGDYDNIEAVKQDFTLVQAYEEKRMSVLHDILAYYNRKN